MIRRKPQGKEEIFTKLRYGKNPSYEWDRLAKDAYHRLEFDTTMYFLKTYLPRKGLILDAGGGPGRYTIELAKGGYDVVLMDLTPENLELAKDKIKKAGVEDRVKMIEEGSIVDLSRFKANSFDAVLCLGGPLSHVGTDSKRRRAVSELIRVAKPRAPIFLSVMGKFGVLQVLEEASMEEIALTKHYNRLIKKGDDYLWGSGSVGIKGLTGYCHYFTLNELKGLFPKSKTAFVENVGLEGLSSPHEKEVNEMYVKHKKAWKNWIKTHYETCTEPSVVDTSAHMLVIYRKK